MAAPLKLLVVVFLGLLSLALANVRGAIAHDAIKKSSASRKLAMSMYYPTPSDPTPSEPNLVDCPTPTNSGTNDIGGDPVISSMMMCDMFLAFNHMGRDENLPASGTMDWTTLCDDFAPLDKYICPNDEQVQLICSHDGHDFVPGTRMMYCRPLFADIQDEDVKAECERWCINYVAKDQGDCCDLNCPERL